MIESPEGPVRLPRQQVAEGQTHGYIGDVETYDPPKEGSSNVVPDVATAERRVAAAKYALKRAEAELVAANNAADRAKTVAKSAVADKERERTADKGA
ncbi:MAG: hypothetical protein KGK07_06305 [Chloroflexota bacterium]|nr:hypothetical protein [Chloroflexota bacterium]